MIPSSAAIAKRKADAESITPDLLHAPILLPSLPAPDSAPQAKEPPLHRLPGGKVSPPHIVYQQTATQGEVVEWISTTHVFPAAYPRSHPYSTTPPSARYDFAEPQPLPTGVSAEEIKAEEGKRRQRDIAEWDRRAQTHFMPDFYPPRSQQEADQIARDEAAKGSPQLWSVVQRIVPVLEASQQGQASSSSHNTSSQGYILLLAHANGFHKETFEPFIGPLLETIASSQSGIVIDEIWSVDTMGSGESGTLNRDHLGETFSWPDGVRDIRKLLFEYLPAQKTGNTPPTCLSKTSQPSKPNRRFIAVGHSYSGAALAMLSGAEPDLFEAIILVDPILFYADIVLGHIRATAGEVDSPLARGAAVRRDVWPSREAAKTYFASRGMFKVWDPRALDLYVQHGLRPLEDEKGQVIGYTLAMSKWTEAALFGSSMIGIFGSAALEEGKYKGKIHIYGAGQGPVPKTVFGYLAKVLEEKYGGSTEQLDCGHLVVQERPEYIAKEVGERFVKMLMPSGRGEARL